MKKTKLLFLLAVLLLVIADASQAGGRCGRWGGGGHWGRGWGGGGYWGGGPYWGWGGGPYWGGGWGGGWGPAFGVSFVAPVPVYRTVYVAQPSYVTYARPTLARAQARLARLGYYPGPVDGAFGPMTNQAIRSFQIDYGLPVTGRLDSRTRTRLGV